MSVGAADGRGVGAGEVGAGEAVGAGVVGAAVGVKHSQLYTVSDEGAVTHAAVGSAVHDPPEPVGHDEENVAYPGWWP